MDKTKNKFYYGWYIVIVGFFIMAIAYASVVSCQGLFIKPITEDLGFSRSAFSITTASLAFGLIIGSVFMGNLIKKYGIKVVMLFSSVIVVAGLFIFSYLNQLYHFYIIAFLIGTAFPGLTSVSLSVLVNNWFGKSKKGVAMSIVFAGSGVGGMILTVLLNLLILNWGWRKAYFMNGLLILILLCPLILFVLKNSPKDMNLKRIGDDADKSVEASGISFDTAKKSFSFWVLFISILLMSLISSAILNHQVPYLTDIGFSDIKAANLAAMAVGSLTIGKILLGSMYDKKGMVFGAFISNLLFALAVLILVFLPKATVFIYIYIAVYCIGGSAATIAPPILTSGLFGEKDYPKLISIMNMAIGLGAVLGSTLCAIIYDFSKNYIPAWIIFFVIAVLIWISQAMILKNKKTY